MTNPDYLVVVELLSHPGGRTPDALVESLGVGAEALDAALAGLEQDGVIVRGGGLIRPSTAVRRLDRMNLIAL